MTPDIKRRTFLQMVLGAAASAVVPAVAKAADLIYAGPSFFSRPVFTWSRPRAPGWYWYRPRRSHWQRVAVYRLESGSLFVDVWVESRTYLYLPIEQTTGDWGPSVAGSGICQRCNEPFYHQPGSAVSDVNVCEGCF